MDETKIKLSFANSVTGEKKLERYEERLKNIYGILSGLQSNDTKGIMNELDKSIKSTDKNIKKISSSANDVSKTLKKMFNFSILSKYKSEVYQLAKAFFQLSQKSSEYIENVNLLEVAYKNSNETIEQSSERIEEYIQKMADVYGLDESRLTRQFGIFKQLANAMQLPTETAENLSEIMVKMTNDIASLYNLDLNRASNALQSALAGQVRPIRSATGADITEKTLQNTVADIGLDRSINELSYVEKRLVMVVSLTNQLKNSQGDYARTIESASNQIRVMHEQWDRLSRAVGNVFYPILEGILPYINAILMALTEIANLVASLLGFKMPEFDYSGLVGVSDVAQDIEDEMYGAGGAVDELSNKLKGLRGFDKLNVINTPSASKSSSAGGGVGSGYVDPAIMDAFNTAFSEYDDKLDSIRMKAIKIKDSIMEWLGFEKVINEETGKIEWRYQGIWKTLDNLRETYRNLNPLAKGFVNIIQLITVAKIAKGIYNIVEALMKEKTAIDKINMSLIGAGGIIIGMRLTQDAMEKVNKEGLTLNNSLELLGGTLSGVLGGAMIGGSIGGTWGAVIGAVSGAIIELGTSLFSFKSDMDILQEEADKSLEAVRDKAKEIAKDVAETEMEMASKLSETNYHEKLLDELDQIVDANGVIKTGYEDRAEYILNELSSAYGVEYELVDGVLQKSDEVKQSLKDQIALKEAEIILEAYKEDYIEALKRQNELYSDIEDAESARNETLDNLNDMLKDTGVSYQEYLELQKKAKEGTKLSKEEEEKLAKVEATRFSAKGFQMREYEKLYKTQNKTVKEARENYINNNDLINRYSDFSTALQTGDMEKVNEARDTMTKTWVKDGEVITNSEKTEANKRVETQASTLKTWKKNNDERYKDYKENLTNMKNYTNGVTPDIVEQWRSLGETSAKDFNKEFSKLPEGIQKDIITKMYQQGVDINSELQRGLDSFEISKEIKTKVNNSQLKEQLNNLGAKFTTTKGNTVFDYFGSQFKTIASTLAVGGMPPVGQLFIANEKGPELVGQIGGQSFVANQNQMMDLLDKKIGNAQGNQKQVFNIYLDDSHLLATYTLDQLQEQARTNGNAIRIG